MHCENPQFTAFEFAIEAESVAIEQCLAWHRNGARPEDLYQQVMGRRPEHSLDWNAVAKAMAGRWGRLRNGA